MNLSVASYYDADQHVAEIYDTQETGMQDVALIRPHIGPAGALRVLDPVCGTGRILVSLAGDGHTLLGLDRSPAMLDRAWRALVHWPAEVSSRVSRYAADVLSDPWQSGYDLVILGGNWRPRRIRPASSRAPEPLCCPAATCTWTMTTWMGRWAPPVAPRRGAGLSDGHLR
jgi:SAM-dependent methyltransferase